MHHCHSKSKHKTLFTVYSIISKDHRWQKYVLHIVSSSTDTLECAKYKSKTYLSIY